MSAQNDSTHFKLSQVLRKEFGELRPEKFHPDFSPPILTSDEPTNRKKLYAFAVDNLRLSALALSGGGIRSACVALGVIQALAEAKLLSEFNYLSTVSGGGYIGSWLSAWLYWNKKAKKNVETVLNALTTRSNNPDNESLPIRHLREYSSYLTPKLG